MVFVINKAILFPKAKIIGLRLIILFKIEKISTKFLKKTHIKVKNNVYLEIILEEIYVSLGHKYGCCIVSMGGARGGNCLFNFFFNFFYNKILI
jgi:hypothetical protein